MPLAIPKLLELLDLKGLIVTVDAMGCQKKIHDDVKDFFTSHELDEKYCESYKIQRYEGELEIGHGSIEKKEGFLCTNIKWLES